MNLLMCSVAATALLVATSNIASAHYLNPSWRAEHGLPPLAWACPDGPDKPCPEPLTPSPGDDVCNGIGTTCGGQDDPPEVIGDTPPKPVPVDPPLIGPPPHDCRVPTPDEMRALCMAGLASRTYTTSTAPEVCEGWLSLKTTGVIPVGPGCEPPPTDCGAAFGTFLHPFSADSPQNRRIPSDASYAGEGDASTRSIRRTPFGTVNASNGWGANVYMASGSDATKTIRQAGAYNIGMPITMRVPAGVDNGNNSDSALVLVDGDTAHEFYQWRWNDGNPVAGIHRSYSISGPGAGGNRYGVTASGVSVMLGLLRGNEVNTPGTSIDHVLNFTLPRLSEHNGMMLSTRVVWPASSTDGGAGSGGSNQGPIPYGGLLALPKNINVGGLGLSEAGTRVAKALQDYGAYATDGSMAPAMRGDQTVSPAASNAISADLRKIFGMLRLVTSNGPGGGSPAEKCTAEK